MTVESIGDLFAALGAEDFDRVLGTREDQWIEFKRDPYPMQSASGKWELVKDVAALANGHGGAIVLGVETRREQHEIADIATEIRGVRRDLVNPDQYLAVIESDVRPTLVVKFHWFPTDATSEPSIFVIEVDALEEDRRYAVLRRMLGEQDRLIEAVGIPVRRSSGVRWLSAEEVHRLVNQGLKAGTLAGAIVPRLAGEARDRATKRIRQIEDWQDWTDLPVYFLQGIPPPDTSLIRVLLEPDGIRGALENMDCIRPMGWNLRTDRQTAVQEGSLVYLNDPRRAITIDSDGLLSVGAIATRDYLGWAQREPGPTQPWVIHPLSLVEFTFETLRFIHRELVSRAPGRWTVIVSCHRFADGRGVALPSGRGEWWHRLDEKPASSSEWMQEFDVSDDPEKDAHEALIRVYALFGHDSSAIPFVEEGRVSEQLIRAVR